MSSTNSEGADGLARIAPLLPPPPRPAANYVPVREAGGLLCVAGQTPHVDGRLRLRGIVGDGVAPEEARLLARDAALGAVSALRAHLGDLREVAGIVSVTGYVACTPAFARQPWVIDGASELFIEAFGAAGRHARAAVGVAALPDGAPVEVSVIALRR
ncbi:RidA family protein [Leucobacter allii]|uniref:RidA family protein n=1 Tax=Leucobacter allii TaxID=2932247 RepID=A0ABY4FKY2_9MICO|nr:RidA family protein [Leucobacter allii]UOQ56924.1 RidA family protein [Leucobacter allii]